MGDNPQAAKGKGGDDGNTQMGVAPAMGAPLVVSMPFFVIAAAIVVAVLTGFIAIGPCIGDVLILAGIVGLFLGTGIGLATTPWILAPLDVASALLLIAGLVAGASGIC